MGTPSAAVLAPQRSARDVLARRILRVPDERRRPGDVAAANRLFSKSLLISATRCLLTYIVLPVVAPLLGVATGVGPVVGLVIGALAIVSNVASMRRFFAADHRYRWHYAVVALAVMGLVLVLMVGDVRELTS